MENLTIVPVDFSVAPNRILDPLWQYDAGVSLKISGATLPDFWDAQFSNKPTGDSVSMIGSGDTVQIPDEVIVPGSDIYVYIRLHASADNSRTVYSVKIPVVDRTDITDREPTPEEQDIITQLLGAMQEAVDQTEADAAAAAESAQAAAGSAEAAEASATRAETAAAASIAAEGGAEAFAQAASEAADRASNSASDSSLSAQEAAASATAASGSASWAARSEASAAESAANASASAVDAQESAAAAEGSSQEAEAAAGSAEASQAAAQASAAAAAESADSADESSQSAKASADYAESVITRAMPTVTASGNPITITDGSDGFPVRSLSVDLEPQQDGTPWIAQTLAQTPYKFRASGEDVGNRAYDKIVGGSIVWNQLTHHLYGSGVTQSVANGVITCTPTAASNRLVAAAEGSGYSKCILGHKYLATVIIKSDGTNEVGFQNYLVGGTTKTASAQWVTLSIIGACTQSNGIIQLWSQNSTVYYIKDGSFMFFDLTAMFGTIIADYIYSLEQTTAGAGVAFFRSLFPGDYYPYNPGEIQSVSGVSARKVVGFNQWDEETTDGFWTASGGNSSADYLRCDKPIRVIPDAVYHFTKPSAVTVYVQGYDINKANGRGLSMSNTYDLTIPSDVHYIGFAVRKAQYGATYKHDICINLSDADRNGEYEPYTAYTYPLDDSLTLRGLPMLDGSNLYYDGDEYKADGTVTRKYRQILVDGVNLKVTAWGATSNGFAVYIVRQDYSRRPTPPNAISDRFLPTGDRYPDAAPMTFIGGSGAQQTISFILPTTVTSVTEANAWFAANPTTVVYELATPTTESATSYASPQIAIPGGTEEYVTDGIPVGHQTRYAAEYPISGHDECVIKVTGDEDEQTYTVDLGGMRYGGTLDVVKGILTVDMAAVDLGSLTWATTATRASATIPGIKIPESTSGLADILTEKGYNQLPRNASLANEGEFAILQQNRNIIFYYSSTLPSGLLVYELATPLTVQLTPEEVKTFLGDNRFEADGEMTLQYRADFGLFWQRTVG